MLATIAQFFTDSLNWLLAVLLYIPQIVYGWFTDGIVYFIQGLPSLNFINQIQSTLTSLTSQSSGSTGAYIANGLFYMFGIFNINYALGVAIAALSLRFAIRRLPFVG